MGNGSIRKDFKLLLATVKKEYEARIEWDKDDKEYILLSIIKKYIPDSATNRYRNNMFSLIKSKLNI